MKRDATPVSLVSSQLSETHQARGFFNSYKDREGAHQPAELTIARQSPDEVAARMRAEDAALARELDSLLIVDSIPAFVVLMTPAGELEHVNRQMQEYFGEPLEELKHRVINEPVDPDDLPHLIKSFANSIHAGQSYEMEHRCRRFDGVYRWFHARGLPLSEASGRIVRWYFLLTDVEDRKQAETQLAGDKQLLEMIAAGRSLRDVLSALCRFVEEAAPDCYCGVYPIDWSGPTFQYGVAPSLPPSYIEPIKGLPVRCDIAPCGIAAFLKTQVIVADIESDPRWHESEYRTHVLAHGLRSICSTPIYSLEGRVLGTFCIYQRKPGIPSASQQDLIAQVTHIASIAIERSQAEAALKRSEALLAAGQRLSLTGTFFWRVATDEIIWSEQVYRIFDFDPAVPVTIEMIGARVHPEDLLLFRNATNRARLSGGDFEYEQRLQMPDNSVKYLHVVAHGSQDEDGRTEYIGAVQDVTERRLSEVTLDKIRSELAHVTRVMSLGTLTASIAHELNQPLSGIVTNASTALRMLAADPANINGASETARRTIRDANRASEVITRLRALYSKKEPVFEAVNLNEATREVIALSSSELQRNRVILQIELAEDLPLVMGDRVQLQQVVLNLLLNASDAMKMVNNRPRKLLVRTKRGESDSVRVVVQDSGVGFDSQTADRLFEAFYTSKRGGMGMGLSVSRSIIEGHHGRIWAAVNDGPGATFSFSIPCGLAGVTPTHSPGAIRTHGTC